ncbi:MAG: hypothetical protein P8H25_00005, partial [Flavobacteriaceae bacterium]|nr:hypothetical protein [Flavobacteriaceae bacterium]
VTATMNEATTVDTAGGTPTYTIDVGGVSKTATYVSGTGTTALVFSYTILPGDEDIADGITAGTAALALAGGTLKDAVGNNAVLTTPEVVAGDNTIVVDMVLTAAADSSVAENAAYTSTAPSISGNDPSGTITYSLTGADAGDFTVNATTGVVSMVARDFETPADADMDNVYNYTLVATDTGGDTATDAVVVTVTNVVVEMTLTAAADSSVAENAAYTSAAPTLGGDAPVGTVTYTLSGDDAGDFTVNASTGVVSMVARDFENPADADTDNVYNYTLVVTDTAGNTASDAVVVTVTNVAITLTAAADSSVAENAAYTSAAPTLGGDATSGTVTYTLTGADAAQFTVNASTGVVSMVGRDFENPADAGTNNVYNYNLVATATGGDTASDAVVVTVTNRLEIDVTLAGPRLVLRDSAATNTTVASFSTDDGTATVAFTPGSNVDGYYNISGTNVRLTAAGATFAFGGGVLPAISLTVTDATDSAKTDVDTATPVVSALPLDLADMTVPCDGCRNQGSYSVAALFDDVVSSGTNGYLTNAKTFRPVFNTPLEIDYILFGKTSNSQFINGSVLTAYADAARTIPIDLTLTTLVADNPDFLTIVGGQVEINGHNATTDVVLDFSGVTTLINAISLTGSDTSYMLFSEFDVYLKP